MTYNDEVFDIFCQEIFDPLKEKISKALGGIDIMAKSRERDYATGRSIFYKVVKEIMPEFGKDLSGGRNKVVNLARIGKYMGGRDHTTVMVALRKDVAKYDRKGRELYDAMMDEYSSLEGKIAKIKIEQVFLKRRGEKLDVELTKLIAENDKKQKDKKTVDEIIKLLQRYPMPLSTESELQMALKILFMQHSIPYKREVKISAKDKVDFMVQGDIAVEVKIKGSTPAIYRQCKRYCENSKVKQLMLLTNRAMGFPKKINGKPCYVVPLDKKQAV